MHLAATANGVIFRPKLSTCAELNRNYRGRAASWRDLNLPLGIQDSLPYRYYPCGGRGQVLTLGVLGKQGGHQSSLQWIDSVGRGSIMPLPGPVA